MWNFHTRHSSSTGAILASVQEHGKPVSFAQLFGAWRKDPELRRQWVAFMRNIPFNAYCWENPPLTASTANSPSECVFVESPTLAGATADIGPFSEVLRYKSGSAIFRNLGGDALLVAPCRADTHTDYAHIAAFMRTAPEDQAAQFWHEVGCALNEHLTSQATWLSTAGLGVSWVHVRLDSHPKYYRHRLYAESNYWSVCI